MSERSGEQLRACQKRAEGRVGREQWAVVDVEGVRWVRGTDRV